MIHCCFTDELYFAYIRTDIFHRKRRLTWLYRLCVWVWSGFLVCSPGVWLCSGVTGAWWAEPQTTPTSHWTFLELPFEPLMQNNAKFSVTTSLYFTLPPQRVCLLIKYHNIILFVLIWYHLTNVFGLTSNSLTFFITRLIINIIIRLTSQIFLFNL